MSVESFLAETRRLVDASLDEILPPASLAPHRLHEAMRYAVFAGGKRIRPAIARAAWLALGGDDATSMPVASALEMLHTYSLIHDDLPAIDDDDLRRGEATCHKRFDEATAILAGDALHSQAFLALTATGRPRACELVVALARAAGSFGMVGGEIADIEAEGQEPDAATVELIHTRKTAALFEVSATMGGIAADATSPALDALQEYGRSLGLAFQIVDDVLDETSDAKTMGKSTGKDRAARKMTYPAVVGLDESRVRARNCADAAIAALAPIPNSETLAALARFAVTRIR